MAVFFKVAFSTGAAVPRTGNTKEQNPISFNCEMNQEIKVTDCFTAGLVSTKNLSVTILAKSGSSKPRLTAARQASALTPGSFSYLSPHKTHSLTDSVTSPIVPSAVKVKFCNIVKCLVFLENVNFLENTSTQSSFEKVLVTTNLEWPVPLPAK